MRKRLPTVAGWSVGLLVWLAAPAGAQVATTIEKGKRVFVNAEPAPTAGRAATPGSSTPSTLAARTAPEPLRRLAAEAAERHQLDPALIFAMIEAESAWNPLAVSVKGAQGLMQLIPGTAQRFGVRDAFDPAQNVEGGVKYMRWLLERYAGDLEMALAAYNAGEGAVDRWGVVPNFAETRAYVQKVVDSYFRSDSGRRPTWWDVTRPLYRVTDARGRVVYTNE